MKVSIIIPCHNEADSIAALIAGVKEQAPRAQIIVVNDGSTDGTARVLGEISGIVTHHLDANKGKGVALQKGIEAASGDVVVFIDGDGQDSPADLPRLLREVEAGSRFVNGSKFIGVIEEGGISRPNRWGNRFMSGLIHLLFGGAVSDSQSGFRAIDRELIMSWRLVSSQYEIETEMLCKALKAGVKVKEVPVVRRARTGGKTGFRRVRNGLRILGTILRERLSP